jgi:ATP-dependent Clp protease ATP-binding subunit ClpB
LEKLLGQRQLTLDLDNVALDLLATRGYDPDFGARPLKRLIQRELQNVLAQKILEGSYKAGDEIHVTAKGSKLVVAEPASAKKDEQSGRRVS